MRRVVLDGVRRQPQLRHPDGDVLALQRHQGSRRRRVRARTSFLPPLELAPDALSRARSWIGTIWVFIILVIVLILGVKARSGAGIRRGALTDA